MDPDIALTMGAAVAVFSIPSILSALTDGRSPRVSLVTVLIGGGLIVYALRAKPGGYTWAELPHVFATVVSHIIP